MILNVADEKAFYFSYNLDLTTSIQANIDVALRANMSSANHPSGSLAELINIYPNSINYQPHFAFNNHMLKDFQHIQYAPFRIPVIYGFIYIRTLQQDQHKFDYVLFSKKDCRRPGRRFIVRGIDRDGNIANHVQTEHVITLYEPNGLLVSSYI